MEDTAEPNVTLEAAPEPPANEPPANDTVDPGPLSAGQPPPTGWALGETLQGRLIEAEAQRSYYANLLIASKIHNGNPAPLWDQAAEDVKGLFRRNAVAGLAQLPNFFDDMRDKLLRAQQRALVGILAILPNCPLCSREKGNHELDCQAAASMTAAEQLAAYLSGV